jgi:hypothetical protein
VEYAWMILFVVNDAGPAKYLSYIAQSLKNKKYKCITSNISKKVFSNNNINCLDSIDSFDTKDIDIIITGTCLNEGIDKEAVRIGKKEGIKTISIIEHWSLYKKRFELNGQYVYPDMIFVNDNQAKEEAENDGLPSDKLHIVGNPVLENMTRIDYTNNVELEWKDSFSFEKRRKIITFVSENFKDDYEKNLLEFEGFDEFDVLNDILETLNDKSTLIIKLHPTEIRNKYDFLTKKSNILVVGDTDINKLIQFSDILIGMGSMLLMEASIIKNTVYSYRPNERIEFIGNKNGMVKKIHNKMELKERLSNDEIENFSVTNNMFSGSTKHIVNLIQENL